MKKIKNAIIVSNGRCGSHWVEKIMIDLLGGIVSCYGDFNLMPNGWVLHTHDIGALKRCPRELRESTMLILCSRENKFNQAISYYTAQQTNEWLIYSDKKIAPFTIDPVEFRQHVHDMSAWYTTNECTKLPTLWPNYAEIVYEKLANSQIPEKYVAECLGMKYKKTEGHAQQWTKKNPRDYQKLILNWNELVAISKKSVV